jgi:hypothetical protein
MNSSMSRYPARDPRARRVQPSLGIVVLLGLGPRPQLIGERGPALPGGQIDPATGLGRVALQQHGEHLQIDRERAQEGDRRVSRGRAQPVRHLLIAPEAALLERAEKRGRHLRSPRQALRRGHRHTIAGQLQHLAHGATVQRGKQRHAVLRMERATQGPQPVLVPSLSHDPDGDAPPRTYDAGTHRFPSARLRARAGAPGAWGPGGVARSAAPFAAALA